MGYIVKNPYTTDGNWYVGQLHFHTNNSDGGVAPSAMEAAYNTAGYHYVVTTDHRTATYCAADDGCTPDPGLTSTLWISGAEIFSTQGDLALLGISGRTNTAAPWATRAASAEVADCITSGGIAMIVHPRQAIQGYWNWYTETLPLSDYSLIEFINGFDYASDPTTTATGFQQPIDLADEFKQYWWTTTDDAHGTSTGNGFNQFCTMTQTDNAVISQNDIIGSLDAGNFYMRQTSTGPAITGITDTSSSITVSMPSGSYTVNWYKKGRRLASTSSSVVSASTYTLAGTEGWVQAPGT